jgi:hypothetical protein
MKSDDIASIQRTTKSAATFFPRLSSKILSEIDHDQSVGTVRDDFRDLVENIGELRQTAPETLLQTVAEKQKSVFPMIFG